MPIFKLMPKGILCYCYNKIPKIQSLGADLQGCSEARAISTSLSFPAHHKSVCRGSGTRYYQYSAVSLQVSFFIFLDNFLSRRLGSSLQGEDSSFDDIPPIQHWLYLVQRLPRSCGCGITWGGSCWTVGDTYRISQSFQGPSRASVFNKCSTFGKLGKGHFWCKPGMHQASICHCDGSDKLSQVKQLCPLCGKQHAWWHQCYQFNSKRLTKSLLDLKHSPVQRQTP